MMTDEFEDMLDTISATSSLPLSELERYATVIRSKWTAVAFTEASDLCLRRYYNFHFKSLLGLMDDYPQAAHIWLSLVDDLLQKHTMYVDLSSRAPELLVERELGSSSGLFPDQQQPVGQWLRKYYASLGSQCLSVGQVNYLKMIAGISLHAANSEDLEMQLVTHNFNHTGLLHAITVGLKNVDRGLLQEKLARYRSMPVRNDVCFDQAWPALKEMVCSWLKEEIRLLKASKPPIVEKLHFDTSVAHLAFLVRLFHEEGLLPEPSLTRLFKQVVTVARTKKQTVISEGSFSKEFYATDQHTAGRVRDLLQRMLSRLNRRFFP